MERPEDATLQWRNGSCGGSAGRLSARGRISRHSEKLPSGFAQTRNQNDLQPDEWFLEKTPSHALYIPEIKQLLPDSRFIHLVRDCRDVVASLMTASQGWGASWAPSSVELAAAMWAQAPVDAAKVAAKNLSPQEFREIRYEDLWKYFHSTR